MRRSVPIYVLILFILTMFIGGSVFTTWSEFIEEGPLTEQKEVYIPRGKSLKRIANILHKAGVIKSPAVFVLGVRAAGYSDKMRSGEYAFPKGASGKMVMLIIASGQTYIRKFRVPEGLSSYQIVQLMDQAKGLTGTISKMPKNGTLLPDTYHYSYGDTKESMLSRMRNAMDRTIAELWESRAEGLPFQSPKEAIILASVVEKETGLKNERPLVASVFVNRLQKGMKLQSDPTVIFALTDGRYDLKRALKRSDLKVASPYNTYYIKGLPRTAIANPGRAALEAVLHPAKTDNLYFVADGTGGHSFSKTYGAHQKNVQNWRAINNKKGAKAPQATSAKESAVASQQEAPVVAEPQPVQQKKADAHNEQTAAAAGTKEQSAGNIADKAEPKNTGHHN